MSLRSQIRPFVPLPLAALVLAASAMAALPEGTEPYGPEVLLAKEDSVPVRTEPGFVYREIGFLKKGQEVVIDGRKGSWLHARPVGWILADHLVTREQMDAAQSATRQPEPAPRLQAMAAVRPGIRVRASPSTDAAIARTLSAGEEVQVVSQEAGWWKLADGGYVAAALLQPAAAADAPADVPDAAAAPQDPGGARGAWVAASDDVAVRAAPSADAALVRRLVRGEVLAVGRVQDGWAEVDGGWVRADLLQAPQARAGAAKAPRAPGSDGPRRWSLVDLNGVIFEITDISRSELTGAIKKEMKDTGLLEEDWTFLGLTIGVPGDAPYRFNYAPDRNTTVVVDADGQKYGNIYARGPVEKLPAQVRQFFLPMTVAQGEKYDGVIMFRPTLRPEDIREISMFIGGRMQRFFEAD